MPQPADKLESRPDENGHFSVAQLIKKARMLHTEKWRWEAIGEDTEFLVRPRTHAENAEAAQRIAIIQATANEEGEVDPYLYLKTEMETVVDCLLWPDGAQVFQKSDIPDLMEMDSPTLHQLRDKVNAVSNWNSEKAKEVGEGSGETGDDKSSSDSPEQAEMSTSSPIPIR